MSNLKKVTFTAPGQVEVREEALVEPAPTQALVKTIVSAISPGTEMLIYRGEFPDDLPMDETIPALSGQFSYPLCYGYACVGQVIETGSSVGQMWKDRLVFSFQPHCSYFVATPEQLFPLPEHVSSDTACLLPNMETSINLVQDAAPLLGERVLVFGQGIVGLLTAALLAEFPLDALVSVDPIPLRREASLGLGLTASLDPREPGFRARAQECMPSGSDLTLEISGAPEALDEAIALTGYAGRVVVGSWYGRKQVTLDLGGRFHRSRIKLIASQVSSIAPHLSARWDKPRRLEQAWAALARVGPERWITHRFPIAEAKQAYALLDTHPQDAIQVVIDYS